MQGYQIEIDPTSRAAFRQGEWNHIRLRAVGTSVKTWINGVPATDYIETLPGTATTGFIALQVHEGGANIIGKKVRFRNLRLSGL